MDANTEDDKKKSNYKLPSKAMTNSTIKTVPKNSGEKLKRLYGKKLPPLRMPGPPREDESKLNTIEVSLSLLKVFSSSKIIFKVLELDSYQYIYYFLNFA